jgi:TolB-like protein/Tfp pilus assembly protein PilF
MNLFDELKRRNVIRVGIAYAVVAWLVLQLTEVLTELLGLPQEIGKTVVLVVVIGFIPALVFAWVYEMTPEGIKKESEVDRSQSVTRNTGRKLDRAIIVVLAIALGWFAWDKFSMKRVATPSTEQAAVERTTVTEDISVAVMPFVNMSSDAEQEFFSDGITEEILNQLVRVDGLRVTSRSSAFSLKGQNLDIPTIADKLGVNHVVEGSVRKAGSQIRVTAQLIRASDDSHLWSDTYDRELNDVFAIQDEISLAIAEALQVTLGTGDGSYRAPTDNIEAYEIYLRGRALQATRNPVDLQNSVELFAQATELDPGFANAYAQAAVSLYLLANLRELEGGEFPPELAREKANRAIELDPDNALALVVLAQLEQDLFNWKAAQAYFDRAVAAGSSDVTPLYWAALHQSVLGFSEKSLDMLKEAESQDPLSINVVRWLSNLFLLNGQYERSAEYAARAVDDDRPEWINRVVTARFHAGDVDGARAYLDDHPNEWGDFVWAALTNPESHPQLEQEARDLMEQASSAGNTKQTEDAIFMAEFLNQTDLVMEGIEQIYQQDRQGRLTILLAISAWTPRMAETRNTPEFKAWLESTGLVDYWRETGFPPRCRPLGEEDFECD